MTLPRGLEHGALERLGAWFAASVPGAAPELAASLITGGKSNLTYLVTDGAREWIVRRPPLGPVLATAHDMTREHRVISALAGSAVPVPRTYGLCTDDAVLGVPFYVMERCSGTPYERAEELNALGVGRTRTISERLVDTLVALHAVVPDEVGLSNFGRPQGYLARQVDRWRRQLQASHHRDLPLADELRARLSAAIPRESGAAIVHGDYRLDNVLVDSEDRVTAVLDWEMATLGDPLSDLALMLMYQRLGTVHGLGVMPDVSAATGFLTEPEILERYAAASGRDLGRFDFHLGLAAYKLAGILEGIHHRYVHGQTVGPGFDDIGDAVVPLLQAGLDTLKEND